MLLKLIRNDINFYCAHTNLDIAAGGVNDVLTAALGCSAVFQTEHIISNFLIGMDLFHRLNHCRQSFLRHNGLHRLPASWAYAWWMPVISALNGSLCRLWRNLLKNRA